MSSRLHLQQCPHSVGWRLPRANQTWNTTPPQLGEPRELGSRDNSGSLLLQQRKRPDIVWTEPPPHGPSSQMPEKPPAGAADSRPAAVKVALGEGWLSGQIPEPSALNSRARSRNALKKRSACFCHYCLQKGVHTLEGRAFHLEPYEAAPLSTASGGKPVGCKLVQEFIWMCFQQLEGRASAWPAGFWAELTAAPQSRLPHSRRCWRGRSDPLATAGYFTV